MRWIQTLSWEGLGNYNSSTRLALTNPDTQLTEAYVKAYDRLKFYWILGAGHSVGGLQSCALTHRSVHAVSVAYPEGGDMGECPPRQGLKKNFSP